MKTLLTLLVLLFSSSLFADDISDFQIEGMSIGDSLLDYFSEKEILSNKMNYNKEVGFETSEFYKTIPSNSYDSIGAAYRSNDKKFIIHKIWGLIFYSNNIKDCYSLKNKIVNDLSFLFEHIEWQNNEYKDQDGFFTFSYKDFKLGGIGVSCFDWNNEIEMEKNWTDHLEVYIETKEYDTWMKSVDTIYSD